MTNSFSVFTKPWRECSVTELIETVKEMGFDAVEFPLRDGYQVTPAEAEKKLPLLADRFRANGVRIDDVASGTDEHIFAACAASGIPMIRIMYGYDGKLDAVEEENKFLRLLEEWSKLCDRYGVKLGLQMHHGFGASTTAGMMRLVGRFDPKQIGAIWDAAHSGLAGEEPEQAIDICWSHLALVNFKNARYEMKGRTADGAAEFDAFFCPGPDGKCSWPRAVAHLKAKGYKGTWCMPAEYTGLTKEQEIEYTRKDLVWLKSLVEA